LAVMVFCESWNMVEPVLIFAAGNPGIHPLSRDAWATCRSLSPSTRRRCIWSPSYSCSCCQENAWPPQWGGFGGTDEEKAICRPVGLMPCVAGVFYGLRRPL
jgi:hypothetical protein